MRDRKTLVLRGFVMVLLALAAMGMGATPASAQAPACVNEPSLEFFDANGDGVLSLGELQAVASQFPDPELQSLVAQAAASPSFGGIQYRGCSSNPPSGPGPGSGSGSGTSRNPGTTTIDNVPADLPSDSDSPATSDQPADAETSTGLTTQSEVPGCEIVELYPGYPGYRGNITGVMPLWNGQGDYECLETLQDNDPQFDRAEVDQANQEAAEALGIEGPMELWTWENWLQIEGERGLLPSCYTCLMVDTEAEPLRTDIQPEPGDYRILTGMMGQATAIRSISNSLGISDPDAIDSIATFFQEDDYLLRVTAYVMGSPTQNAQELYEGMERWVQGVASPNGISGSIDPNMVLQVVIWERGGYTPPAEGATGEDQLALMSYGFALAGVFLPEAELAGIQGELEASIDGWLPDPDTDPTTPLATYMQEDPVWQEYEPQGS